MDAGGSGLAVAGSLRGESGTPSVAATRNDDHDLQISQGDGGWFKAAATGLHRRSGLVASTGPTVDVSNGLLW